jgi:uncharacterized protein (UPF0335 family)
MLAKPESDGAAGIAGAELLSFIQRVERLREERKTIDDDVRDVFAEAKSRGYSVPAIKELIKERAVDADESKKAKRDEQDVIVDLYRRAIEAAS